MMMMTTTTTTMMKTTTRRRHDDDDDDDSDDDEVFGDGDGDDDDNDDNNELSMDCPPFLLHPSSDSERLGTKNASYFISSSGLRLYSLAARLLSCVLHR